MGQTKGNHVQRVLAQDGLPEAEGAIELALGPRGQRGDVAALSCGGAFAERLGDLRGLHRDRDAELLEGEHGEVALHAVRQRKVRIGFKQGRETGGRIGSKGEVAGNQVVEGGRRPGVGGRKREPAVVEMHRLVPFCTHPDQVRSATCRSSGTSTFQP